MEGVRTERLDAWLELPLCGDEQVLLELLADAGKIHERLDPVVLQYRRVSNTSGRFQLTCGSEMTKKNPPESSRSCGV